MARLQRSAVAATSSSVAFTNTPTTLRRRCSSALIVSAFWSEHARGLCGQKIIPSAQAPRSATRRASAGSLTPQILTRVTPAMLAGAAGRQPLRQLERQVFALVWRLLLTRRTELVGPLLELDLCGLLVVAAVVLDLDGVAGLLGRDRRDHVVGALHRLAVHRHDHVAAARDLAILPGVARPQAGLVGRAAVGHGLDDRALVDREVEPLRERLVGVGHRHAEVRALDLLARAQLGQLPLGGVDRHREAD